MKKIVINKCFGGFGLSEEARILYEKLSGKHVEEYECFENSRDDEILVSVVEQLGDEAGDAYAELEIIELPDNSYWLIDDYDGIETVYYSESEIKAK